MSSEAFAPGTLRRVVDGYLEKRQLYPFQIIDPVPSDLDFVVVIPCLAEPGLVATLESLARCRAPRGAVEVLVVVNHPAGAAASVVRRNQQTLDEARRWYRAAAPFFRLHLLDYPDLPAKRAGVGLARKLGLDEAANRLSQSLSGEGLLVFLDADCEVAPNYLEAIDRFYARNPEVGGATVEFEHPLTGPGDGLGIAQYELHLRYYVEALRWAGVPDVFHTVGSCLTVRSTDYARQGGMNRRQAGEDYYFVQKLAGAVKLGEISETRVFPSARLSWRVPFGTGRAMADNADLGLRSYDPRIFADLARWVSLAPKLYPPGSEALLGQLPDTIGPWLDAQGVAPRLAEVRSNTASAEQFIARLFRWFNGFRCLKYVHYASDQFWPRVPVEQAAAQLLEWQYGHPPERHESAFALLDLYRQHQASSARSAQTCARQPAAVSGRCSSSS